MSSKFTKTGSKSIAENYAILCALNANFSAMESPTADRYSGDNRVLHSDTSNRAYLVTIGNQDPIIPIATSGLNVAQVVRSNDLRFATVTIRHPQSTTGSLLFPFESNIASDFTSQLLTGNLYGANTADNFQTQCRSLFDVSESVQPALTGSLSSYSLSLSNISADLRQRIYESKMILHETDEGECEYQTYKEETWNRAVYLIVRSEHFVWSALSQRSPLPAILRGPDGDIDLVWRNNNKKILVSIPADENDLVTYYANVLGDSSSGQGGIIAQEENIGEMLKWLNLA